MSDSNATGCSEPVSKRARTRRGKARRNDLEIPTANASCKRTILDCVHKDCMQMILDYLSIEDILRSMTVSKQWQAMILEYLRGSKLCLEHYEEARMHFTARLLGLVECVNACNSRTLPFRTCSGDAAQFRARLTRLGPSVATIILDRLDEDCLKAITHNCPNLNNLMLIGMQESQIVRAAHPPNGHVRPQKELLEYEMLSFTEEVQQCLQQLQLKRISFVHSPKATEAYIGQFLKSDSIEELIICRNKSVDGHCLSLIQSPKLKSLRLIGCALNSINLTSIADRLTGLTTLELSNNPVEVLQNVHLVLAKTPDLENLVLNTYAKTDVGSEFVECLGRLGRLRRLSLCWNSSVRDEWLAAVAAGCSDLHTLDIEAGSQLRPSFAVSGEAVLAMCRGARRSLARLGLAGRPGLADSLAAIVGCCPNLQSLDVRGCSGVSWAAVSAGGVPAPRAAPLRLRLARTAAKNAALHMQKPEGLIFDFVDAPDSFRLV